MTRRNREPRLGLRLLLALAVMITTLPLASLPTTTSAATPINFVRKSSAFKAPAGENPTSVALGPDGKLYVASQSGRIFAVTFDSNYSVTSFSTITTIYNTPNFNDDGSPATGVTGRMALGIAFDPTSSPAAPIMYVSHSDPRFGFAYDQNGVSIDTKSGTITRLVGPNFDAPSNRTDVVTGLPRSRKNHGTNNVTFGPDGWLYIGQGGNTSLGVKHPIWTDLPESYLSAAILRANVRTINSTIDVGGVEDGADLAAFQGKVELFATGTRNPYDLVWHSNGNLYVNDNGANPDQGTTPGPADGCPNGAVLNPTNQPDKLLKLSQGGYGGHPNPSRGECILDDGTIYNPDKTPEPNYQPPVHAYDYWGGAVSVDGIDEYPTGAMTGNLISATFSGDKMLRRVVLNANGSASVSTMSEVGPFANPVDVTIDQDGVIYVAEYGLSGTAGVSVLIPDGTIGTGPSLSGITPNSGTTAGGTSVTLTGLNFAGGASVTFGGQPASNVNVVNSTTITAITPPHAAGAVNVTVTNPDNQTATLTNGYTYVTPGGGTSLLRVNAGGGGYNDSTGKVWSADTGFTGGGTYSTGSQINGTVDDPLYRSERYGNHSYTFNVENGDYLVTLKFAEIYWTSAGQRIFDVTINGQLVLDDFDIVAEGGAFTSVDKSFPTTVTSGTLTIQFTTVKDNAKISAIEVIESDVGDVTPPNVVSTDPADGATDVPVTTSVVMTFDEPMDHASTEAALGMTPQPPPGSFSWSANDTVMTFTPFLAARGFDPDREYTATIADTATDVAGNPLSEPYVWVFTTAGEATDTTPPTVTATPPGGEYDTEQSVTLSANEPATIYFTTNGANPTTSSPVYSSPINISSNTTLKFFGVDAANNTSTVVTEEYVITDDDVTPPVVTATPAGGTYSTAQSVTLSSNEPATIYFTTNGSTPTQSSPQYANPISIDETTTLKFFAVDTAGNSSTVVTEAYTIETVAPAPDLTSISPTSGPDTGGTGVTLTGSNFVNGASVTFDGLPATSISVVNSTTITAISPAHASGAVNVTVINPDAQTDTLNNAFTYTPTGGGTSLIRINSGGGGFNDSQGNTWSADSGFSGGKTYSTGSAIAGTVDDNLYRTERYGNHSYTFNVANGNYLVTLKFAEIYWTSPGQRVFDVAINGQVVLDNFDILAETAQLTALDKTIPVSVTGGTITITFTTVTDNAKVSAIQITGTGGGGGDTTPPVVSANPAGGTYTTAQSVTLSANEPATIYYTVNGSTPTTGSTIYSGPINISTSTALKFFGVDTSGNASAVVTANYVINAGDTTPPVVTATPDGGTYTTAQSVTLSANEPATIRYTTNGANPTASSPVYSSPINISSNTTLKFFGVDTAGNASSVVTETYVIQQADTTPPTVSATPKGGTYSSAQSVTLSANEPATIRYTTNGSNPTMSSPTYSTPINIGANTTLKFFGVDTAGNASTVVTETYVINIPDPAPDLTSVTPSSGPISGGTGVTLTGTNFTSGATVTFGGSNATNVVVVNSTTITAVTPAHAAGTVGVTVTNSDDQADTLANAFTFVDPGSGPTLIRVNAGGGGYTDSNGDVWTADTGFSGGRTFLTGNPIAGTIDDTLYRTERYGNHSYSFQVPNGTYDVTLKFAEIYWTITDQRLFDVAINGQLVLDDYDIVAEGGAFTAVDETIPTTVTNGTLTIQFTNVKDNAKISAIQIQSTGGGGGDTTPPTVSASPAGGTYGSAQSVTLSANEQATIHYTTNGSNPTASSPVYSTPINISSNTTLKFFGVDTAGNASSVVTETYVIDTSDPAPDLTSVTPSTGPTAGSTDVTLSGSNFASGAEVTFDGVAATDVVVVNGTTITATTPPHGAGAVNVTVTNSDDQSDTLTGGFTYVEPSAEGQWTEMPPLPEPRAEVAVVEAGGKIYVIGGGSPSGLSNDVFVFDPATGQWTEVAPYPGPALDHIGAASVNGTVYIMGGLLSWPSSAVNTVYAYNPTTNTWTRRANLPRDRGAMGVAVHNGLIYAVGGLIDGGTAVGDLTAYNPATNTWTTLAPMPTARDHLTLEAAGGLLYAMGGRPVTIQSPLATNQAYNPATNTWENRAPLPTARGGHGSGVLDGKIVIFGGEGNGGSPSGTFGSTQEYDPATNSWRELAPMITPRHGTNGAVLNDVIYVPAGGTTQGGSRSAVHEAFSMMSDGGTLTQSAASLGFFGFIFACLYRARRRASRA